MTISGNRGLTTKNFMKQLTIILIVALSVATRALSQSDTTKGIAFAHGLNWQEVLQKAKQENKYVFVDCYATWCAPCKYMDKKVYPVDSVGTFMNANFISVRVQMDSTRNDDDETQKWYSSAHDIQQKYHIGAFPSYLFFSSDGHAVHMDIGGKGIEDFLSVVKAAL